MSKKTHRPSDYASASPPPDLFKHQAEPDNRPVCIWCKKKPISDQIKHTDMGGVFPFCSDFCAVESMHAVHQASGVVWCEVHQQWTGYNGFCDECDLEGMGPDDRVTTPEALAIRIAKEGEYA